MKVKICGLTSLEDTLAAAGAGADMLGFNFFPKSPRFISTQECRKWVSALKAAGAPVTTVGVFVNEAPERIVAILDECGLDLAQLSGDEPPGHLEFLGERGFKALRLRLAGEAGTVFDRYPTRKQAPAWLVDAYAPGQFGGTGQMADWTLASSIASRYPVLLAGGLTPENVSDALRQVNPWGVDVASGVESSPGKKDQGRVIAFIEAVRQFNSENRVC
ncbi:MAG: phosphoribosylanthranilate isomerase [Omnitrophica WOR_2 bacterium]